MLRGKRFSLLTEEALSPEQRAIVDRAAKVKRALDGSLSMWLRSVRVADPVERLGEYVQHDTSIPKRLKELAICVTARHWNSKYPWSAHYPIAAREGIKTEALDQIAVGKKPVGLLADEQIVYDFTVALLAGGEMPDMAFSALQEKYGETGVIDLIGIIGYYCLVCMNKNVDLVPAIEGKTPPLMPLGR